MKQIIHIIASICVVGICAKPTLSPAGALANELEAAIPGSVFEFVAWGREEGLMEQFLSILTGDSPAPENFQPFTPPELRYLTMYLRPDTTMDTHVAILRNATALGLVISDESPEFRIAKQNHVLDILFTFPEQLFFPMFNIINDARRLNMPVDYHRIAQMCAPEGMVSRFESRLRIWDQVCFSDPQLEECYREGTEWKLRESGKMKMYRHLAWTAVSKRIRNNRK